MIYVEIVKNSKMNFMQIIILFFMIKSTKMLYVIFVIKIQLQELDKNVQYVTIMIYVNIVKLILENKNIKIMHLLKFMIIIVIINL
jgi:hypothetical protein